MEWKPHHDYSAPKFGLSADLALRVSGVGCAFSLRSDYTDSYTYVGILLFISCVCKPNAQDLGGMETCRQSISIRTEAKKDCLANFCILHNMPTNGFHEPY